MQQPRELERCLRPLMIRGLEGDSQAYRQLLGELSGYLREYFACRIAGPEVEGLVQETLLGLHSKRASYDRALPLTPWVLAIARYKLNGHVRRNRPPVRRYASPMRTLIDRSLGWLARVLDMKGRRPRL